MAPEHSNKGHIHHTNSLKAMATNTNLDKTKYFTSSKCILKASTYSLWAWNEGERERERGREKGER